jgi:hypothetical protein
MLTKSETTAKPPSCHSLQVPPGYSAVRSCRTDRVRGTDSDSRRRRSGLQEPGTVPKLAHSFMRKRRKFAAKVVVPGERAELGEPKTRTKLINMRKHMEAVASGAKAHICQAVYGGAEAPTFRTPIYEMTSSWRWAHSRANFSPTPIPCEQGKIQGILCLRPKPSEISPLQRVPWPERLSFRDQSDQGMIRGSNCLILCSLRNFGGLLDSELCEFRRVAFYRTKENKLSGKPCDNQTSGLLPSAR